VTARFASASVTNRLIVRFFLRGPNIWKTLRPNPSTGLRSGCRADAGRFWTVPLYFACGFVDSFMCLIFSIRLHFVHTSSQVCFGTIRWGCREQDTLCYFVSQEPCLPPQELHDVT